MYVNHDHFTKFLTIEIQFADLRAKNDFKRATATDPIQNRVLDFERIFPLPPNSTLPERVMWRNEVWGSDAMDSEGETMAENGTTITFELTTKIGIPIEFVKNLYLYSRIKKIRIHCTDSGDITYANGDLTAPCNKQGCNHEWCDVILQQWEAVYDWSRLPHPLLEVGRMLNWIKDYFNTLNDTDTAMIYHLLLHELIKFGKHPGSSLVQEAKTEFERQVAVSANAYLHTMAMLNEYDRPPQYIFKYGQRVLYKDAVDYYLKKTQPVQEIPRF